MTHAARLLAGCRLSKLIAVNESNQFRLAATILRDITGLMTAETSGETVSQAEGEFTAMKTGTSDQSPRSRKPWHGTPGPPHGPRRSLEQFLDELFKARDSLRKLDRQRELTKKALYERLTLTRPSFNEYMERGGVPFPLPAKEHLVFVVQADETYSLLWVSETACTVLGRSREEIIGQDTRIVVGNNGNAELREIARQLRAKELEWAKIDSYLTGPDDRHIPVELHITWGEYYDVWFVDARVIDDADVPQRLAQRLSDSHDAERFNVESAVIDPAWASPQLIPLDIRAEDFLEIVRTKLRKFESPF